MAEALTEDDVLPQMENRGPLETRRSMFMAKFAKWKRELPMDEQLLASRWQQWSASRWEQSGEPKQARLVDFSPTRKQQHNWWWNNGDPPAQATLSLRRGDTSMNRMFLESEGHPLLVVDSISGRDMNWLMLDGKVNQKSKAADHQSIYNIKVTTVMGFNLTYGYSRYRDGQGKTHAWIAFGEDCVHEFQRRWAVDMLLNIVGYQCYFNSDGLGPAVGRSLTKQPQQRWVPKLQQPQQPQQQQQQQRGASSSSSSGLPMAGGAAGAALVAQPLAGEVVVGPPAPAQPSGVAGAAPSSSAAQPSEAAAAPMVQPLAGAGALAEISSSAAQPSGAAAAAVAAAPIALPVAGTVAEISWTSTLQLPSGSSAAGDAPIAQKVAGDLVGDPSTSPVAQLLAGKSVHRAAGVAPIQPSTGAVAALADAPVAQLATAVGGLSLVPQRAPWLADQVEDRQVIGPMGRSEPAVGGFEEEEEDHIGLDSRLAVGEEEHTETRAPAAG
jgi:hypothetical protein